VPRGQRDGSPCPYSRLSRLEPLLLLPSSSSILPLRLSGPRTRPAILRKSGSAGNRTRASGSVARNFDHQTTEAVKTVITANGNTHMLMTLIQVHI
jgi:hypothetical protein